MRTLAVSAIGLVAVFLLGFIIILLAEDSDWELPIGILYIVVAVITVLLAGRFAPAGWSGIVGAIVALLSILAVGFGGVLAELSGMGSPDNVVDTPGWLLVLASLMFLMLPVGLLGAVLGRAGTIGTSRGKRA